MSRVRHFVKDVKIQGSCSRQSCLERKRGSRRSEKNESNHRRVLKKATALFRTNAKYARAIWGELPKATVGALKELVQRHTLSVAAGDLQLLDGRWYVTHSGLLRMAERCRCSAITTAIDRRTSDPSSGRWVFKATVYKGPASKGFVGYGDADPSNVSAPVRGAEMRVAETRAVNRALRKAYGIGICSVEELGALSAPSRSAFLPLNQFHATNASNNGQPRLRDQLCVLIRQHNLDPGLVKAYAADFCGTETLSGASRELVQSFISHLATSARENRDALVCKLNSYAPTQEVQS